jgi:DNA polymerase-3 subunit beta
LTESLDLQGKWEENHHVDSIVTAPAVGREVAMTATAENRERSSLGSGEVRTKDLVRALRRVMPAVSKRPGIPALTGVLIESRAGKLRLTATDLELTITTEIECGDGDGRALVPAKFLLDVIRNVKTETIRISGDGASFTVGAVMVRELAAEDFPAIKDISDDAPTLELEAGEFTGAVSAVAPSASGDWARPILTGLLLEAKDNTATLAATDSYRLHVATVPASTAGGVKVLLPEYALSAASKALGKRPQGNVVISAEAVRAKIRLPDSTVYLTRTIEGEFPNYKQLIPEPADTYLEFEPAGMLEAVRAATIGKNNPVRFDLNGAVEISANSPDLGTYAGTVAGAVWHGEDTAVRFNPYYLADMLEATGADRLEIRDGLKPAMARGPKVLGLLMPVRVPEAVR